MVDISGIQTRIVGVESQQADHKTTPSWPNWKNFYEECDIDTNLLQNNSPLL